MAALQSGYINAHDAEEALRPAIGAAGIAAPYWPPGERLGIPVQAEGIKAKAQAIVDSICFEPDRSPPSELLIFSCVVEQRNDVALSPSAGRR